MTEKPKDRMLCFRLENDLHRRLKVYLAERQISAQDWLCKMIETTLKENK